MATLLTSYVHRTNTQIKHLKILASYLGGQNWSLKTKKNALGLKTTLDI